MEHDEVRQLRSTFDELNKKIDRQEWRLRDLEKKLSHIQHTDSLDSDLIDVEESYKEPILKKADKRMDKPKKVPRGITSFSRYTLGTFFVGTIVVAVLFYKYWRFYL